MKRLLAPGLAVVAFLVTALIACAWGWQRRPAGFERYVPKAQLAGAAIASVLDAWRAGRPDDAALGTNPAIHLVDKHRKEGQRLKSYEILGEVATENARGFAVRLKLENPDESPVVRFLVLGIDPLWVFRQEDYELIAHWMHKMDPPRDRVEDPNTPP
jgi:hypothetical protein